MTDSIVVFIDLNRSRHHENNTSYRIAAIPQVFAMSINSTGAQLQVSYNTQYNVSITATLCGHSNATIVTLTFSEYIRLHVSVLIFIIIVKCIHPQHLQMIDDSLRVLLDNELAVVGTNASFSCLPGQMFSGPYKSTCLENGEWEPDPREVQCIGKYRLCEYMLYT